MWLLPVPSKERTPVRDLKLFTYDPKLNVEVLPTAVVFPPSEEVKDWGRAFAYWLIEDAPSSFYDGVIEVLERKGYIKEVTQ